VTTVWIVKGGDKVKAKIVMNNLEEPLNDELIVQCLRHAHDKNVKFRDKPEHQAIVIYEIRDYCAELHQDWAVIFVEGGERTIEDFARCLELSLFTDVEIIWE